MNRKPLAGLFAAVLASVWIALAGMVLATPGNALACSGGLGENCARAGGPLAMPLGAPFGAPGPFGASQPGQGDFALPGAAPAPDLMPPGATRPDVRYAAGSCASAAAQAAAAQGGQVIGAPRQVQQGGRTMCVVTVLVKDPTGKSPPTRRQVTVPAN